MGRVFVICLCLTGCTDWPDASGTAPPLRESGSWPSLVPTSELFESLPQARDDEAETLAARAAALRGRAAILRRPVTNSDQMEALRTRLAR